MSEFVRYTETHLLLTTHDAVALIDNAGDPAGALSAAVDLRGVRDFNLEVTYNGSGATDDFIVTLLGSIDGTEFGDAASLLGEAVATATSFKKFEWSLPQSASEVTRTIAVKDFPFPYAKVKVASAGATDTFTATVRLQRVRIADTPQQGFA